MSEPPRTEAGQLLLEEVGHQFKPLAAERIRRIEEQAAAEARRELLAKQEERLADLYVGEQGAVAVVCDEALDRSGALLGRVRARARLIEEARHG